jgi:hypothetical protein
MTDLTSMGTLGTSQFDGNSDEVKKQEVQAEQKSEEVVTEAQDAQATSDDATQATDGAAESQEETAPSVEEILTQKEEEETKKQQQTLMDEYERELQAKMDAAAGVTSSTQDSTAEANETTEAKEEETIEVPTESDSNDEIISKAKNAIEASQKIAKTYEEENERLARQNREYLIESQRKEIENEALRKQRNELIEKITTMESSYISTDDVNIRYYANLSKNIKQNSDDTTSRQALKEHLIRELQLLDPQARVSFAKQDSVEVNSTG